MCSTIRHTHKRFVASQMPPPLPPPPFAVVRMSSDIHVTD